MYVWSALISGIALVAYFSALVLWTRLVGRINRKLWTAVWLGFALLLTHRSLEMADVNEVVGALSALAIALIALLSAVSTYQFIKRLDTIAKALKLKNAYEPVSERLAEHLVHLKEEIEYYELKADEYQIPKYPHK